MKNSRRLIALLLALALCVGLLPAGAAGTTLRISTPEQLVRLSQDCTLDAYSRNLTVLLTADIHLTGAGFQPIPIFCGVFDGNGHTVSGLTVEGRGSDLGFIRYVEAGAVVKDLTLQACVRPEGSQTGIGGVAGQNEGTIENCTVSGLVEGGEEVGGIAGRNLESGLIRSCSNQAAVTGSTRTGGIAGYNTGVLQGCRNEGAVNITENEKATDTGGIAGRSAGSITDCVNRGDVGYQHTGYNSGGIAGLQSGSIQGCENYGTILGRKDVGGIVGQFEPEMDLVFGADPVDQLNEQLGGLSTLLSRFTAQLNGAVGDAADDMGAINGAMGAIRDAAQSGGEEGRQDAEAALDSVYASSQKISGAMDDLLDAIDTFSSAADTELTSIGKSLKELRSALSDILYEIDSGIAGAGESIDWEVRRIENAVTDLNRQLKEISNQMEKVQTFVSDTAKIIRDDTLTAAQKLEAVRQAAEGLEGLDLTTALRKIGDDLQIMGDAVRSLRQDLELLYRQASEKIGEALDRADKAADDLSKAAGRLREAGKKLSDASTDNLRIFNRELDSIEDVLNSYLHTLSDKSKELSDQINGQLETINRQVEKLTTGAKETGNRLQDTTDAIIDQLDGVRRTLVGMSDAPEKNVDDVSDNVEQEGEKGKVLSCLNAGTIAADSNVGGIAGISAPELDLDPEEDLDLSGAGNLLLDSTTFIRATLRDCRNQGNVTAKNDCAGGILGRGDVGAVLDCVNTGDVEATGDKQCGGIAGLSRTVIRRCYALSSLTGNDCVGGIAGEGRDVQDCRAMVTIDSDGEKLGAIAGRADGEVTANYFVREGLAGIDGVDYQGKAEPMRYEDFAALPGLPGEFLRFAVTFVAEGRVVATLPVAYGGSLEESRFPALPQKEGYYGAWEEFDSGRILRSRTVNAVYTPWVSTLASGELFPNLLVEGAFGTDAQLEVSHAQGCRLPQGYRLVSGYTFAITGTEAGSDSGLTVRVRAEEERAVAAVLRDGVLTPVDSIRDGTYLVLSMDGPGTVAVIARSGSLSPLLWGGAGALLALGVLWVLLRRRKRVKKLDR